MECNDGVCAAKTAGYGDDDMRISSRFTVALHIFTCVDVFKDDYKVTSDFLAGSISPVLCGVKVSRK